MDPWTAVQCASAVVGFVNLARRVMAGTYKTDNGASELRSKAKGDKARSGIYEEFDKLCGECENAIKSILKVINKVCTRGESNPSLWSSLKESVGTLWNQKEIQGLQAQLERYQQQLPPLMIAMIRKRLLQEWCWKPTRVSKRWMRDWGDLQAVNLKAATLMTSLDHVHDERDDIPQQNNQEQIPALDAIARGALEESLARLFGGGRGLHEGRGEELLLALEAGSRQEDGAVGFVPGRDGGGELQVLVGVLV
ncbi:hypothetical protein QBC35DRAFT_541536 [Podospora australis]|uniref:Fungal N-terminal domain-containing protein n=1 Tax=Podospora australis TaxID=1536484 RepID=A0AAN6WPG5_9PEZI|nr:hypothetical protein QBC35DRAFT_541536 [Podospora australis]